MINTFNRQYKTLQHRAKIILSNIYIKCIIHVLVFYTTEIDYVRNQVDISKLKCDLKDSYTLYKNAGFWLVNNRDMFLQIQALHCEFAEFYFM